MSASVSAIASYFKMPAVWLNGILAALGILGCYFGYHYFGYVGGSIAFLIFMLILPLVLAGTYGIVLDGNRKFSSFFTYARYGYGRCISPVLLITALLLLIVTLLGPMGFFLGIPILFFTYFADITAIRHNLGAGSAIIDSAKRVARCFLIAFIFLIGNLIALLLAGFVYDWISGGIMSLIMPEEAIANITTLTQSVIDSITANTNAFQGLDMQSILEIGKQILAIPGLTLSFVLSAAIIALIFMPFFVAYKAFFFRDMLRALAALDAAMKAIENQRKEPDTGETAASAFPQDTEPETGRNTEQIPQNTAPEAVQIPYDPHAGEDGEYDDKGRWFKYR